MSDQHSSKDLKYLHLARQLSARSRDPSTKVGAVILDYAGNAVAQGWNRFPVGTRDDAALWADREVKYERVVHAEMAALLAAGKRAVGGTIYCWPGMPCARCAAHLVEAGIARVVSVPFPPEKQERWGASVQVGTDMMREAGVNVTIIPAEVL